MDAKTYSILSVLVSGLCEDPHLYEQVINIAVHPEDPHQLQELAKCYRRAFDQLFSKELRFKGRVSAEQADKYVLEVAKILQEMQNAGGKEAEIAEWARTSILWTQKQIQRDELRMKNLKELRK